MAISERYFIVFYVGGGHQAHIMGCMYFVATGGYLNQDVTVDQICSATNMKSAALTNIIEISSDDYLDFTRPERANQRLPTSKQLK